MAALIVAAARSTAHAQQTVPSPAVSRVVARARGLIENGAGAEARALLDSLVGALAPASDDLAEALYWRATLAERATDAERDWKRLTIESPLSPRAADALVRLGELEMLRAHPATARPYFGRVIKDFADTPQRTKATLWVVRSWFDERNTGEACTTLGAMPVGDVPDGELRLQYDELKRQCGKSASANGASANGASASAASATDARVTGPAVAGDARFSVQLAAYDTRAEAEASVRRLKARDIDARIDGDDKPFRVRVGRFARRADAIARLAALKTQGLGGFVAELRP
jgi:hypothetical protein